MEKKQEKQLWMNVEKQIKKYYGEMIHGHKQDIWFTDLVMFYGLMTLMRQ